MVRDDEIERYMERKLRAFSRLGGVYARLSRTSAQTPAMV